MNSYINYTDICNIPIENTCVYKDECAYCFDRTDSEFGLFICMKTFIGICRKHLDLFYSKSSNRLFLNIKIEKRVRFADSNGVIEGGKENKKILKEAILNSEFHSQEFNSLWLLPEYEELKLPATLPDRVSLSVQRILCADSVAKSFERAEQADNWDGNFVIESKYSWSLEQLNNGVKVAPSGWKCCYCDLTNNLWMNLTDGTILCGRKFFDGSGGNNHAMEHFQQTGYPLAVKLGTITPKGADVFSYIEDVMVCDCLLAKHLAHFGIDIMKMEKTDKSTEEIEMESINTNRERIAIMETGTNHELLSGPGLSGIVNIGNSCYMNSVLQVLLSIKPFQQLYSNRYLEIIKQSSVFTDVNDFRVQLAKLGHFLQLGVNINTCPEVQVHNDEIIPSTEKISPHLLRSIIGKGHADFSTNQQQDTYEYLIHVLNFVKRDMKKNCFNNLNDPLESLAFKIEDRIFCESNGTVKYRDRDEFVLSLGIDLDQAINKVELAFRDNNKEGYLTDEVVRPIVTLQSCLDLFMQQEAIADYVIGSNRSTVLKSSRLKTFPEYLWIQSKRFTVDNNWTPKKLDVEIDVPDRIDLSNLRANGLKSGEAEMTEPNTKEKINLNESLIAELLLMGFPENSCKKAVFLTGNSSLEAAANWLMMHIDDPDFDVPPKELCNGDKVITAHEKPMPMECDIEMMGHMGFNRQQGIRALQETGGNLERAADWAFSHPDELASLSEEMECESGVSVGASGGKEVEEAAEIISGCTTYSLGAMISHMGNNAHVGHYVCHIKQADGSWVLYNDESVSRSDTPPKKFAYLYLFKRDL